MEAAQLFAYVLLMMGPIQGRTLFSLLEPLILVASTKFVTKVWKGMCLFSVGDLKKSQIIHHITRAESIIFPFITSYRTEFLPCLVISPFPLARSYCE